MNVAPPSLTGCSSVARWQETARREQQAKQWTIRPVALYTWDEYSCTENNSRDGHQMSFPDLFTSPLWFTVCFPSVSKPHQMKRDPCSWADLCFLVLTLLEFRWLFTFQVEFDFSGCWSVFFFSIFSVLYLKQSGMKNICQKDVISESPCWGFKAHLHVAEFSKYQNYTSCSP